MMNAVLAIALLASPAQEKKEVTWLTKYQDALQQAAKEGKPIVIDSGRAG